MAWWSRSPAPRRALTASAAKLRPSHGQPSGGVKATSWQTRSLDYYDQLGEVWYAAQFYARALSKLELYAAELNADDEPERSTNATAIALLDRVRDPGGSGRAALLAAYGRLRFLTGEALLVCSMRRVDGSEEPEETWEMLSVEEVRRNAAGVYQRTRRQGGKAEELVELDEAEDLPAPDPETGEGDWRVVVYRFWSPHPRFSGEADAPLRAVLDLCEELLLLSQGVRSQARSRAAGAGLLYVPNEISPAPETPPGMDPNPADDELLVDLTEAMTTPIGDETSASAVVPMILRGPAQIGGIAAKDALFHMPLAPQATERIYPEQGLRRECIERIALGLDLPPEVLMGVADANHWTAWQIDEAAFKQHIQPVIEALIEDLSAAYWRDALDEAGLDPDQYLIAYDESAIVNHPDRTTDAKELHDRFALSDEALREAAGFDETDAPTPDEQDRRAKLEHGGGTPGAPAGGPGGVAPGAPAETPPVEAPPASVGTDESSRILGAAELAVTRAREAAGARLRAMSRRYPTIFATMQDVANRDLPARIGADRTRELGADPRRLVAGSTECLVSTLSSWGLDSTRVRGVASAVETHAARHLFEPRPPRLPTTIGR